MEFSNSRWLYQAHNFVSRVSGEVADTAMYYRFASSIFRRDHNQRLTPTAPELMVRLRFLGLGLSQGFSNRVVEFRDRWRISKYQRQLRSPVSILLREFFRGEIGLSEAYSRIDKLERSQFRPGELKALFDYRRLVHAVGSRGGYEEALAQQRSAIQDSPTAKWVAANDWVSSGSPSGV